MKKIIPYLVVFLITSGAAAVLIALFLLAKPSLLPPPAPAPVDSLVIERQKESVAEGSPQRTRVGEVADSVQPALIPVSSGPDSGRVPHEAKPKVSIATTDPFRSTMDSSLKALAAADSIQAEQRKSMAKVLEAMDPSSAARILNDFPDGDVKQIILTIKRRQAAKILAALDPDRAARIMR